MFPLVPDMVSVLGGQCVWHVSADCGTHGDAPSPWHCHSSLIRGERLTRSPGYMLLSPHCWKPAPTAQFGLGFNAISIVQDLDFLNQKLLLLSLKTPVLFS